MACGAAGIVPIEMLNQISRLSDRGIEKFGGVIALFAFGNFVHEEVRYDRMPRGVATLGWMESTAHRVVTLWRSVVSCWIPPRIDA